tara:strand:+ start:5362 stop:6747 length:1386 start_codon:yes stop_codon:yes gene_type:complete
VRFLFLLILILFFGCEDAEVKGCTDSAACNYNSNANTDDGSCYFGSDDFCDCYDSILDDCGDCDGEQYFSVLVSLQGTDSVGVVNANNLDIIDEVSLVDLINDVDCSDYSTQMECEMMGCMWHTMDNGMTHCMDMGMSMGLQPHDIAVDNTNGYWFTTTMMGGEVAMYCAKTNAFLSKATIGNMPALMSIDENNMIIYVSQGNTSMGSTNNIYQISYANEMLDTENIVEWDVKFDYAHGIHFDEDSDYVYTVSKTNDFIARFNPNEAQEDYVNPEFVSMDSTINEILDFEVNRLRPVEIEAKYPYMFITCSAGEWNNNNEWSDVPGQVQMWHMDDMTLLTTFEFEAESYPWHIVTSPTENKVFVSLAGDNSGVACLEWNDTDDNGDVVYTLSESWITTSATYGTMHGITMIDGNIFASGRHDGNLYKFNANTGEELGSTNVVSTISDIMTGGIGSYIPTCD